MKRKRRIVVLFDIDGTLLDTHGFGREAFIRGLERVTGARDELGYLSFAGNTDRNVLEQVMAARGLRLGEAEIRQVFATVAQELQALLRATPAKAMTGADRLLAGLEKAGYELGLVTGNIRACAFLKLGSVGFDRYFRFGGFGDEFADRAQIARTALAAARAAGVAAELEATCLVGDTPFDVAAGLAVGIRVVGVATGKFSRAALTQAGAALALDEFADGGGLLEWLEAELTHPA
jgi:phosphoglycolate phosphatase-like HAD superfamily hydrolase